MIPWHILSETVAVEHVRSFSGHRSLDAPYPMKLNKLLLQVIPKLVREKNITKNKEQLGNQIGWLLDWSHRGSISSPYERM